MCGQDWGLVDMGNIKKFDLSREVTIGDKPVSSLQIKELTGEDILAIEREVMVEPGGTDYGSIGSAERIMRLSARAAGILFEDLQKLPIKDINGLGDVVSDFL
jgi:hypothetical protein